MPASPISKEITLPDNWVQLQKTMIPDQATGCYWSVWFDINTVQDNNGVIDDSKGTAWLMWCPFGDDPSVNDNWGHSEEIGEESRNVLDAIESVYGVSFHECIWVERGTGKEFTAMSEIRKSCGEILPSGPVAIGRGETWDGE